MLDWEGCWLFGAVDPLVVSVFLIRTCPQHGPSPVRRAGLRPDTSLWGHFLRSRRSRLQFCSGWRHPPPKNDHKSSDDNPLIRVKTSRLKLEHSRSHFPEWASVFAVFVLDAARGKKLTQSFLRTQNKPLRDTYWQIDVKPRGHSAQYSRVKILRAVGSTHYYDLCRWKQTRVTIIKPFFALHCWHWSIKGRRHGSRRTFRARVYSHSLTTYTYYQLMLNLV